MYLKIFSSSFQNVKETQTVKGLISTAKMALATVKGDLLRMRRPEIVKPQETQLIVVGNTMIIQLILQSYIFERNLNVVENVLLS